jgi:hypothetical protein
MTLPHVLALDFDGVLCDGMREYFETSRRTHARVWPEEPMPGVELFPVFRRLRPVILSGWEMPLLLRAIAAGRLEEDVLDGWEDVRDEIAGSDRGRREALIATLAATLDRVRREWIADDPAAWLAEHAPYCALDELRDVVTQPERTVLVTTKEGEFARRILDGWDLRVADVQGKEAGTHKCDNLRTQIETYLTAHGRRPLVWFVEDRLETLEHVTTHADLSDVGLFLAAWGYTTAKARAAVPRTQRVRLLELDRFRRGLQAWA